jgi:hypothetical protein
MKGAREFGARFELIVYVASPRTKSGFRAKRQDVTDLVECVAASALSQDEQPRERRVKR